MADQADKSDDLIAELAKLMASNAQGPEGRGPATVKVAGPGTPAQPRPSIRIPGMDGPVNVGPTTPAADADQDDDAPVAQVAAPAAASNGAASAPMPGIRIPGMEPPASAMRPAAAPTVPPRAPVQQSAPSAAAPAAQSMSPAAAVAAKPSPMPTNAAPRPAFGAAAVTKPAAAGAAPSPAAVVPPRPGAPRVDLVRFDPPKFEGLKVDPIKTDAPKAEAPAPAQSPQVEAPKVAAPQSAPRVDAPADVPMSPPVMAEPASKADAPVPNFDFDFGFGTKEQSPKPLPEFELEDEVAEPEPQASGKGSDKSPYDPIAALISAELDAAEQASSSDLPELDLSGIKAPPVPQRAPDPVILPRAAMPPRPARPPENDRFVEPPITAPVASIPEQRRPAPQPVTDISDPMAEIESLIGEAVRVDLAPQHKPSRPSPQASANAAPSVAPVVPPLGGQFPPRRAAINEDSGVEAAELAIAAAASQPSRRERADTKAAYKRARREEEQTEGRSSPLRPLLGLGLAASLLVAAGLGVYWVIGMGPGDGEAPLLTADASPNKVPPTPAANTSNTQSSVVFERLDGVQPNASGETLVPRDETQGAGVDQVVGNAEGASDSELASRRVRTVTVRPDGSIVTSENAVAGTSELPVDRPNVPTVPGAAAPADLLVATGNPPPRTIQPSPGGNASSTGAMALLPGASSTAAYSISPAATVNPTLVAPAIAPRIANRAQRMAALDTGRSSGVTAVVGQGPQNLVAPAPQPAPSAPAPQISTSSNAPAYVQLMSLPTEAEARQQAGIVQQRWGSLFNGQGLVIQRAELSGGRVTYRLRLPANSLQNATQMCAAIKSNGGDCFATNG